MPHKKSIEIAVAHGDGIGKEIMAACLKIFEAAKVPLTYKHVEMGKEVYLSGISTGMTKEAKETVERLGILFKGPMETPKGSGVKSINVTARKVWSTFANKRVFKTIPGVNTIFAKAGIPIDLTLVRENIEDTYGGIEHMQSHDVAQCRRLITRPGCEQVHRYALQTALKKNARKVTCAHKANIMKLTDGLFLETFYRIAKTEFPSLNVEDCIIDDMAMKLVSRPDLYDVVVLPNLQGDILSDLCAGLVGGLGLAPSANIGENISIFEAVHGTAPDIAGKNLANPTALLLSGLTMLRHLNLNSTAKRIEDGLLTTLKLGFRTRDVATASDRVVTTSQFADEIIKSIPNEMSHDEIVFTPPVLPKHHVVMSTSRDLTKETVVGVDIFVDTQLRPDELAPFLKSMVKDTPVELVMLSNRGTQVWPTGSLFTECINHYRARFQTPKDQDKPVSSSLMLDLAKRLTENGEKIPDGKRVRVCSLEMLLKIGDKHGFSLAQGQ